MEPRNLYTMNRDPFGSTQWSLVVAARDQTSATARDALNRLARQYWRPLYAYIRRRGHSHEEAEDLVQAFFLRFMEKDYLQSVAASKGRFRAFLLACIKHFLADEYDKRKALKRGGGMQSIHLDSGELEATLNLPGCAPTPDAAYDRAWATAILERAMGRLELAYRHQDKYDIFAALRSRLDGAQETPYASVAACLGLSEAAVRKAVQRLRIRYREEIRRAVSESLAPGEEIDDELRLLLDALH